MTARFPHDAAPEVPAQLHAERERDADVGDLSAMRTRIGAHLQATQGTFRQSSAPARFWPLALACVAVCAVLPMALRGNLSLASGAAILALVLGGLTVALAPFAPGRAEWLARGALVLALAAGAHQLVAALASASSDPGHLLHCATSVVFAAAAPGLFLAIYLLRAKVPVRRAHAAALAATALLCGCVLVWSTCPSTSLLHVGLAHLAVPFAASVACAAAVTALSRRRLRTLPALK